MPRPIATSSRPRPISTNKAVKQTTRPRPIFTGKSIKPTLRPKVGPGRRTVITNAKPSLRRGSKVGIVSAKGSAARKNRKQVVLTKQNQALILKALKRIGRRISSALLLSALQNMGCGQPLSAAQAGCLGQYLNDPGCQLTADEQGCIQQCLAGDGDPGVDDGGDTGGEDNAVSDTDDGSAAPDEGGVLIQSVKEGAAADQAGLRAGDVILSFGDVRTHTFDELQDAVGQASGPVKVVFVNGENGQTEYVMVEPEDGLIGVTCE
jgi:S1-C subfamily serine protease